MSNRSVVILIILACMLHGWAIWRWNASPPGEPPLFSIIPPQSGLEDPHPFFAEEFIIPPVESGLVHVASVCEKADGKLAAVWYAGSREAAPDVVVYLSERDAQKAPVWSTPRVVADPASASRELGRLVGKVGNPVLFSDSNGRLWLVYVTMPFGGWSGSSLNVKTSADGGFTWSNSKRLTLSPFFNISELVRNNPVPLQGGGFALPIYHECMRAFPEMLRLYPDSSETSLHWKKTRMAAARDLIQPSIVAWNERSATAFFRTTSGRAAIAAATTEDGGATWSEPFFLDLPNPNASLSALMLPRERVLLAFNDSTEGRENLRLALSSDRGAHWTRIATLENTPGGEFSYPYMIRDRSGRIHIVYTWRRQSIKHVTFNDAWIEDRLQSSN